MALPRETKSLGVRDAVMHPILSDTTTGYETEAGMQIVGIRNLSISPSYVEQNLRGDDVVLDQFAKLEFIEFSFENAKISLENLRVLLGGTVDATLDVNSVETKVEYKLNGSNLPGYFRMEAQSTYTDAGDMHIVLHKCKLNSFSYSLQDSEYALFSVSGISIPSIYNESVKSVIINKDKTPINEAAILLP